MTQLSVNQMVAKISAAIDDFKLEFLQEVAKELAGPQIQDFPVDTGAYAESMSVVTTPDAGRSRTSRNRERKQGKQFYQSLALSNMYSDIQSVITSNTIYFTNQSPHASIVEYGGYNWNRGGYFLYSNVRAELPQIMTRAAQTVRKRNGS